ncbi:MAG: glycosyltransferase family 4 protein [Chloroflexi bacterium]|nr:glycosyltransferase family 4 protein [Chloroflexota bacterium]
MPFRIAILGHFPVNKSPQGGVQAVIANLRDVYAARSDVELHLIQHRRDVPFGVIQGPGYVMHNVPASGSRIVPNMVRTSALLAPILAEIRPDAISSHQPEYALAGYDSGFPTLHTIHGFPANEFWTRRGLFIRAATLYEVWLERRMLRRARHLVAISDRVIRLYRRRTSARFHRIDNPIAPLFFEPARPPSPHKLLLVGNLTPRKGVEVALEALARVRVDFPNVTLDILGAVVDKTYAASLREQARALGQAVRFRGPTNQVGVRAALEEAQILLLTSREEHAPMIVAEAMATGRPVVATDVGALADMVAVGETGYLAPSDDAAALAAALARLLADPAHAAALGQEAARRARERFHPQAVADAYLRALKLAQES